MKRKLVSFLLVLTLVFFMAAGCNGDKEPSTSPTSSPGQTGTTTPGKSSVTADEGPSTIFPLDETFEFSYWVNLYQSNTLWAETLNDHPVHKEIEKLTNVHVDFQHPTLGSEGEQFGILLASEKLPDVITTAYHSRGAADLYYNDIIIDLTIGVQELMPNYWSHLSSSEAMLRDAKLDTGEIVTINSIYETVPLPWQGPMVRQDLLDKLGLGIPETVSDWEQMLIGFRDLGVEKPYFITNTGNTNNNFEPIFNVGQRLYRDGDKVKYGPAEPGYREYIELMRDWYSKGLIDKEFSSYTFGEPGLVPSMGIPSNALIFAGAIGAMNAGSSNLGDQLPKIGVTEIEDMYYTGITPPVKSKGDKVDFSKVAGSGRLGGSYAVTVDCPDEKVPTILKYFDFLFSEETYLLNNFGIKGVSWEFDENGKPQFTDIISASAWDGQTIFHPYDYSMFLMPHLTVDVELIQGRPDYVIEMQSKWVAIDTPRGVLPRLTLTDEESSDSANILSDLNTYVDEMTVRFVMGLEPMSNYETFLSTIKSMGLDRVLEAQQAAYDRYLSR